MATHRTLPEIIKAAQEEARLEKEAELRRLARPAQETKTASAALDVSDVKVALALAKVGRDLAESMKKAEEATAASASMSGGPGMSPPQTTLASPGKTPDLSPSPNEFTSRDSKGSPGTGSMTPSTPNPAQVMLDKTNALKAAALAIHNRYSSAAEILKAAAEQPMGGVSSDSQPIAGDKPEKRPDAPGTDGGPKPPATPEAVAAFNNLDADAQHRADMPEGVSSAMLSAARSDPPMAHAQAGASAATKAAAVRAMLTTFGPETKLGSVLRSRLASMKTADPLGAPISAVNIPAGDTATTGPGMPPPPTDPRVTGSLLSALGTPAAGKPAPGAGGNTLSPTAVSQPMDFGPKGGTTVTTAQGPVSAGTAGAGSSFLSGAPFGAVLPQV